MKWATTGGKVSQLEANPRPVKVVKSCGGVGAKRAHMHVLDKGADVTGA
jgi:hypothetical protein